MFLQGTPIPPQVLAEHTESTNAFKFATPALEYTSAQLGNLRVDPTDASDLHCKTDRTEGRQSVTGKAE